MKSSHDTQCFDLAERFLTDIGRSGRNSDDQALVASLALAIQGAVEDWFAETQPVERTES